MFLLSSLRTSQFCQFPHILLDAVAPTLVSQPRQMPRAMEAAARVPGLLVPAAERPMAETREAELLAAARLAADPLAVVLRAAGVLEAAAAAVPVVVRPVAGVLVPARRAAGVLEAAAEAEVRPTRIKSPGVRWLSPEFRS